MSLSFRDFHLAGCLTLTVSAVVLAPAASAQDAYYIPELEISAEHHTNLDLRDGVQGEESVEGYFADVGVILGLRGQRGSTEMRPHALFQRYPDRDDLDETNLYFDLRSQYESQRSRFTLLGRYSDESEYRAEIADAGFDDFDPNDPVVDQSGQLRRLSDKRDRLQLRPEFRHMFTQRVGAGIGALYQTVNFDSDLGLDRTDYDYQEVDGYLLWVTGPRSNLLTGAYAARYQAEDGLNDTDSVGLSGELEFRWSQTFTGNLALVAEQTTVELPGSVEDESNNWGLTFGLTRTLQVSQLRFNVGRSFSPSAGARSEVDQVRVQYDHKLSPRLQFTTAARAYRRRAQGDLLGGTDRDYARGQIGLRWNMTQTLYLGTDYSYIRQKSEGAPDDRTDHVFAVRVGFRGLQPQR